MFVAVKSVINFIINVLFSAHIFTGRRHMQMVCLSYSKGVRSSVIVCSFLKTTKAYIDYEIFTGKMCAELLLLFIRSMLACWLSHYSTLYIHCLKKMSHFVTVHIFVKY